MKFLTMFTILLVMAVALAAVTAAADEIEGAARDGRKNSASGQKLAQFLNWNG